MSSKPHADEKKGQPGEDRIISQKKQMGCHFLHIPISRKTADQWIRALIKMDQDHHNGKSGHREYGVETQTLVRGGQQDGTDDDINRIEMEDIRRPDK